MDQWFVGCGASHIVCEGNSIRKYLGHSTNIVTVSAFAICMFKSSNRFLGMYYMEF